MYVPSLTKYVFSSLSTDNAGMPSFLCYISSHHRWLSDTCTQLCVHVYAPWWSHLQIRTLVQSARIISAASTVAIGNDSRRHIAYMSHCIILFPDIWLGAQVGNNMITSVVFSLLTFFGLLTENQAVLRLQVRRSFFFGCSCLFSHLEIICNQYCFWHL